MATDIYKDTVYLPLEDVESEHCASIVEKGLAQVKGLASYRVELNNHRAAIVPKDSEAVVSSVKTIKDLGYGCFYINQNISSSWDDLCLLRQ